MMSRDTLFGIRARVKAGEALGREQTLSLIDHGIQALVEMAGGQSVAEQRAAVVERERQVRLALDDLREALRPSARSPRGGVDVERARLILDLIGEMLKAKGPLWHREWSFYQPRVDEEFEP